VAEVFISYARANAGMAGRIADALRASGYSVWFDADLPAHRSYSEVIEEQLEAASAVVVLWSRESAASQWVRSEANRARESGRLVQVRLDEARLPMPFDQVQCPDLSRWKGQRTAPAWRVVESSVGALVGGDRPERPAAPPAAAQVDRRAVIAAGALGAAAVAAATLVLRQPGDPPLSPENMLLLQKGLDALQQFDALDAEQPGSAAPAVALLTKAAEAMPGSAEAWGGLAMAYAASWRAASPAERPGLADRTRSAAARALAVREVDHRARAALNMIEPVYRNWLGAERSRRASHEMSANFPIHIFLLSEVLGSVGRWREAADLSMKADRNRFLIPGPDRKVVVNLWAAGRLQEADVALAEAVERWPQHPQVWRTRLSYLLYSGRARDALAMLRDQPNIPPGIPEALVATATATAEGLTDERKRAAALVANRDYAATHPGSAPHVAQAMVAIGEQATALAMLDGYYFGTGAWAAQSPPGGDQNRLTATLFLPSMRPLWQLPAFDRLLTRIGLTRYWRQSGTAPDYRRMA
jgi:tetratricopeptide (TPR) repeat protein